ncbi:MAG TPA: hypothetical protein H9850_00940 [Candidatus Anaerobiospirillum pullistercoris]|uniref:SIR2-like domain-containing protein n=1 Tax=Candidatus Anaerobiospirillum pullistercoris TaxID=2838452 RepID=A0A9D1WC06_9GAMM|nr:hypothetical protein [Candidatus Anaerobiospirillum pullistercoris]
MIDTPSAPAEIGAPSETVTSPAAELNGSTAKPLSKTPIANALKEASTTATTAEKPPKVCFLFGAGAEAYYGMPLGARFAVEIFRRQEQGREIFTELRDHILQQLDPKNIVKRTNAQQQYKDFLPDYGNKPPRIYSLSSNSAGTLIRELIQEHYEDISKFFKEFGSKEEWVLKQLLNDQYDLRLLLHALSQILGLPSPVTNDTNKYSNNPVEWAKDQLDTLVTQIKSKNFFNELPKQKQNEILAEKATEKSDATESPEYSGKTLLACLKFEGESNDYAALDNVWEMPLFTVIALCYLILSNRLPQTEDSDKKSSEKDTNVTAKHIFCKEVTSESLQGILEIIAAASAQEQTRKGELALGLKQQILPIFGTISLIRGINFDMVGSSFLKLLFEELSGEAAPWKKSFEEAKESLKKGNPLPQGKPSQAEEHSKSKKTDDDFPSLQQIEPALPALTLMAQELFFTVASQFLSYKGLIDGLWRYLYDPKANWAKFSQLSCFIFAVHGYILEQANKCTGAHGYYEQVQQAVSKGLFTLGTSATTNYTTLIRKRLFSQEEQKQLQSATYYLEHPNERKLAYLNGSTSFIYDPYLNDMREAPQDNENWTKTEQLEQLKELKYLEHFVVPLMFTQSGTKAMTVVEMNDMYASLFHSWQESDAVVLVGFNCSKDDSHINSMLRKFLKLSNGQKPIIIVTRAPNAADFDPKDIQSGKTPKELCLADFANKLHLEDEYQDCLRLIGITDIVNNNAPEAEQQYNNAITVVNSDNSVKRVMWYEKLHQLLKDWYKTHSSISAQSELIAVSNDSPDEA